MFRRMRAQMESRARARATSARGPLVLLGRGRTLGGQIITRAGRSHVHIAEHGSPRASGEEIALATGTPPRIGVRGDRPIVGSQDVRAAATNKGSTIPNSRGAGPFRGREGLSG